MPTYARYKSHLLLALVFVFAPQLATGAVMDPVGAEVGDVFRRVFVTSTKIDAFSSEIADYDDHIAALIVSAGLHEDARRNTVNWRVIGSTASVDARDHTGTDPEDDHSDFIGIYGMDDRLIASSYEDLWNGSIEPLGIHLDELGRTLPDMSNATIPRVWTAHLGWA